jgi:hypothetical protein
MEGEETRGRKEKALYKGRDVTERLLKVPEYIVFKQWADSLGLPVVEHVYLILEKELQKYKDEQVSKKE